MVQRDSLYQDKFRHICLASKLIYLFITSFEYVTFYSFSQKKKYKNNDHVFLGNMWAQQWNNIYDLVIPYKNKTKVDITPVLKAKVSEQIPVCFRLISLSYWKDCKKTSNDLCLFMLNNTRYHRTSLMKNILIHCETCYLYKWHYVLVSMCVIWCCRQYFALTFL